MPAGNHPHHQRHPYQGHDNRSPQGSGSNQNNLPYLPYPDPNYTDTLTGQSGNIPLPSLGGYQFDAHQSHHNNNIPGHTFSQTADPNVAFAPHQAHTSPTASISPFSSTHNSGPNQNQMQYRNQQRPPSDNNLLNPGMSGSRPSSHNAPPSNNQNATNQAAGQGNQFLSGYSAEDNWFMPWICSTPGADGQAPTDNNNNTAVASASGSGYPLTGPGTGSTHTSSVVLPEIPGRGGHWSEMELDIGSGHHAHRPPIDDDIDPRLGGSSRRTGTYQTSRMRSQPNSPPVVGPTGGFEHPGSGGYGNQSHAHMVKRHSATTSAGGTAGETPGATYQSAQIEDITRWSTALMFLNLYHEHLYVLLPLVHWPSTLQDLVSRRDRHDETFRIFLMSLSKPLLHVSLWLHRWN